MNSRVGFNKNIENQYQNVKAGFSEEEKATSYLSEASLTPKVSIYRHIYLDETQFDIILVTPKLICILEVKNMTGEFYFEPITKQFYVIKNGKKEGRRNPELQLQRAVKVLKRNLYKKGIDFPVHGLIILVSRGGFIVQPPTLFRAIPIDAMCDTLEEMERASKSLMTNDQLNKTRHFFKRQGYKVKDEEIFSHAGISESSIIPGVRCNECFKLGMIRIYSTWLCTKCNHQDKEAHMHTLQEYQMLFGPEITSDKMKWWLGIEDKYLTTRLLKSSSEKYVGGDKNRVYTLKFEPWRLSRFLACELKK